MAKVKGRFYFKRTANDNLIGEFSNDQGSDVATESSDRITNLEPASFCGDYHSTWQEAGKSVYSFLEIRQSTKLYELVWWDSCAKQKQNFTGSGMLCDEILMGNYQGA